MAVHYDFIDHPVATAPKDYALFENRFTPASPDMADRIKSLISDDPLTTAMDIVAHTASLFDYGHPDVHFNDGLDQVPSVPVGRQRAAALISILGSIMVGWNGMLPAI